MVTLRLLGGLAVETPDGPLTGRAAQRRRSALLALLAAAPAGTVSRDKLVAYLWPDADSEHARHLLSVSLYELRKALGDDAILAAGDDLRLNPERVRTDACEFQEALKRDDYEGAIALYAGPFLDGVFVSDAPEFGHWADAERERYAGLWRGAMEALAEARMKSGGEREAAELLRRVAASDPFNARVALRLMEALEAAGDRAGALQHARVHAALLREEFGAGPDAEVEALAERLRLVQASPDHMTAPASPAIGAAPPADADSVVVADAQEQNKMPDVPASLGVPASVPPARPALPSPSGRWGGKAAALGLAAVLLALLWAGRQRSLPAANDTGPAASIAVLPFVDVSTDPSNEYFSDGLTEEIINVLATIDNLQVPGRTSSFAFKGKDADIREIGEKLGVSAILEGSVRKAGDRLRITARLVDVSSGYELWSNTYERQSGDIFLIQDDIARSVVNALPVEITGRERATLVRNGTESVDAYNLYLQGRFFWYKRTPDGFRRAIEHFEQAIAHDSAYALAYTGLADVYNTLGAFDWGILPPSEAYPKAKIAAQRALEINPNLAEGHAALANTLFNYDWDWQGAEREYRRAIELNPGYAQAHHLYALYLIAARRPQESVAQMRRAREADPLSPIMTAGLGRVFYHAGRPDQSIQEYRSALGIDSGLVPGHLGLGVGHLQTGELDLAIAEFQKVVSLLGGPHPVVVGLLGHAYGRAGRREEALQMLRQLESAAQQRYVPAEYIAIVHLGLNDHDRAFEWLEKAYQNRSGSMVYLDVEPLLNPIRSDPRFANLRERVGLPIGEN